MNSIKVVCDMSKMPTLLNPLHNSHPTLTQNRQRQRNHHNIVFFPPFCSYKNWVFYSQKPLKNCNQVLNLRNKMTIKTIAVLSLPNFRDCVLHWSCSFCCHSCLYVCVCFVTMIVLSFFPFLLYLLLCEFLFLWHYLIILTLSVFKSNLLLKRSSCFENK